MRNILMEGFCLIRDNDEKDPWTRNARDAKENPLGNLLDSPGLCPTELV